MTRKISERRGKMLRHAVFAVVALTALGAQTIWASAANPPQADAAQAASPISQSRTVGSWTVRCYRTPGSYCDVSQVAFERQQNLRVLGVAIEFVPSRNLYSGRFVVPLLVSFAKGMTIQIGSYQLANLKFRRCERDGCYVEGVLPSEMIAAMSQSAPSKGTIKIAAVNGKIVTIPIALDGFADGLAQMKQWDSQKGTPSPATP
jgi:invasion protein IalB